MASSLPDRASLLDQRALVLNRSWIPVNVTTVRRALGLLFRDVALAVRPDTYETFDFTEWVSYPHESSVPTLRSIRLQIPIPEVIVLASYDRIPLRHIPFSRRNLYRRDQLRCQYCGHSPGVRKLTIDHIRPRSRGGETSWTNCVLACVSCNGRKGNRTPELANMRLLRKPIRPEWMAAVEPNSATLQKFVTSLRAGSSGRT